MTDDDLERMRSRVEKAQELKDEIDGLSALLVAWEQRQEEPVRSNHMFGNRAPLAGLSRSAFCEIKRIAQADLQKQIDAARRKLADL